DNSGNYDRPGNLIFQFHNSWGSAADKNEAIVRFPSYGQSGHAVTITEPREILEDVIECLAETQITKGEKINEK
ncbi:MAG: hypothetical protein KAR14_11005, partial [Candidatus Aminicenantes bacterium]|nr:hypothetical protein [Candidatus Aminicenantes bacterium]